MGGKKKETISKEKESIDNCKPRWTRNIVYGLMICPVHDVSFQIGASCPKYEDPANKLLPVLDASGNFRYPSPLLPVENPEPIIQHSISTDSMAIGQGKVRLFWRPNNYRRQMVVVEKTSSKIEEIKGYFERFAPYNHYQLTDLDEKGVVSVSKKLKRGKGGRFERFAPENHYQLTLDGELEDVSGSFSMNERTKIITIKNYRGVTIQYAKKVLTAIYDQKIINGEKEVFTIETDSVKEFDNYIDAKGKYIKNLMDRALLDFAIRFKIKLLDEEPSGGRAENWVKDERLIPKLPKECIVVDTDWKKVYTEGLASEGIEFKTGNDSSDPLGGMKTFIHNRLIEEFAPLIAESITESRKEVIEVLNHKMDASEHRTKEAIQESTRLFGVSLDVLRNEALVPLTAQIKLHLGVQERTLEVQEETKGVLKNINKGIVKLTNSVRKPKINRKNKVKSLRDKWW